MSKRIVSTNIRFNLEKGADRAAWEHLQQRDKRQYRSYSKAVITAVNNYCERRGRLDADPYLETREKEDAFLLRVLETVRTGLSQSTPVNAADTLLRLLQGTQPQPIQVEEVPQEDQQEADEAALDFVDSF
uniref:hypothetical protein n=1 Tax=Enterocloster clostridioformis TaxID=1531 RepID=UPI001C3E12EB|nr:hypothetical protein [Enterocloster clostridioformis]